MNVWDKYYTIRRGLPPEGYAAAGEPAPPQRRLPPAAPPPAPTTEAEIQTLSVMVDRTLQMHCACNCQLIIIQRHQSIQNRQYTCGCIIKLQCASYTHPVSPLSSLSQWIIYCQAFKHHSQRQPVTITRHRQGRYQSGRPDGLTGDSERLTGDGDGLTGPV